MDSSTKNVTYSKAGATLTCATCGKSATYQIGQLDTDEWAKVRGKYRCKDCRYIPTHVPAFPGSIAPVESEPVKDDITELLEMLDD